MNTKNKRLLSILLSFTIGVSACGCARQSISSNGNESTSVVSEYESSLNAKDESTKKTTTTKSDTTSATESTTKEKETKVTTSNQADEKEKPFMKMKETYVLHQT